jgi:hypothetical protein
VQSFLKRWAGMNRSRAGHLGQEIVDGGVAAQLVWVLPSVAGDALRDAQRSARQHRHAVAARQRWLLLVMLLLLLLQLAGSMSTTAARQGRGSMTLSATASGSSLRKRPR